MELQNLDILLDVARQGSFAAVARGRGVDPSSVSRTIANLEQELGFALFYRTTRTLSLTEAGTLYLQRITPLVEELQGAAEAAASTNLQPRGVLRVLAPVSFSQLNVVPLLPHFMDAYPDIRLDLQLTDAVLDLVDAGIDIALRLGPLADSSYIARRLAPMVPKVCANPAYLERHGRPETPSDLARHPCLLLEMPGFSNRWHFRDATGRIHHVDVQGPLKTSNAIALKQAALAGLGIILQGEWVVGREILDGSLVDLFPQYDVTASHFDNAIWLLYPSRAYLPGKVQAFADFLSDTFRDGPPWARPST